MDLGCEFRMDRQPAGKATRLAIEPPVAQNLLVGTARIESEKRIFDEWARRVFGLDRCSQPSRLFRQGAGKLCDGHAAVYRPHFDRRGVLQQSHARLVPRQRIELGTAPQYARRQPTAEMTQMRLAHHTNVKWMRDPPRSGQADVQPERQTAPVLRSSGDAYPALWHRLQIRQGQFRRP